MQAVRNSQVSRSEVALYASVVQALLEEESVHFERKRDISRDVDTVISRSTHEGVRFLTATLPSLGKAVDAAFETGRLSVPRGFALKRGMGIPVFMQGTFRAVFDDDGSLLPDADPLAVQHLRQVCFYAYKLKLPYSIEQERGVIASFESNEQELQLGVLSLDDAEMRHLEVVLADVFKGFEPKDIRPRHGPGAVSTGEKLEEKWRFRRLYDSIHQYFPYYEYFIAGGARELTDRLSWYKELVRCQTGSAKVILVQKDSRGPRLISCEPLEFQWIQQGLGRKMMSHLEASWLTRGRVNFTHQSINAGLARLSSIDGSHATLDLKDASDRVSLDLIQCFPESLRKALLACRTVSTLLPDGRMQSLSKYAPMGSALCFPVLSVLTWALCVVGVSRSLHLSYRDVIPHVYVYGDDIIVKTEFVDACVRFLEKGGLKVNLHKSFTKGPFRESCGMDAFKGVPVTPIRLRERLPMAETDGAAVASWVAMGNQLALRYPKAARLVLKSVRRVIPLPWGTPQSGYLCEHVDDPEVAEQKNFASGFRTRWSDSLHRFEFKVAYLKPRKRRTTLDGWQRLLKGITMPSSDSDPSEVVLPRSTRIKRGWMAV